MIHIRMTALAASLLVALSAAVRAQSQEESGDRPMKVRRWSVGLRVGGFSDHSEDGRFRQLDKATGYDLTPEVTSGLDVSRFFGSRSGLTLSFNGLTFAGNAVVMAPVSLTYKFFFLGNGVEQGRGQKPPSIQPWIGAGGGLYTFILDHEAITKTELGAQLSTGLLVPLSRRFDVVGELEFAVAGEARILSYTMGFGVRF